MYVVPPQDPSTGGGFQYIDTPPGNTTTRYPHGTITRTQIIMRTQRWVAEQVPYSQTSWKRDADGIYRQDCSGYVSMAWGLNENIDFWTGNLNTVSHVISEADLKPGDILLSTTHTVIFAGWADPAHTLFDYYEESHPGTDARFVVDAPLARYLINGFTPFRYDGVLDDGSMLPLNPATGLDFTALEAGHDELRPNGNDTAQPPAASWQAGYVPPVTASPSATRAKTRNTAAVAEAIAPPLGFVVASSGVVFLVGGVVIARGAPRVGRRPQRRH